MVCSEVGEKGGQQTFHSCRYYVPGGACIKAPVNGNSYIKENIPLFQGPERDGSDCAVACDRGEELGGICTIRGKYGDECGGEIFTNCDKR